MLARYVFAPYLGSLKGQWFGPRVFDGESLWGFGPTWLDVGGQLKLKLPPKDWYEPGNSYDVMMEFDFLAAEAARRRSRPK